MKPRPVAKHAAPAYPTRREFLAVGASALVAVSISGCGGQGQSTSVAPIFVHGEGRGATGCVVVSPPVFLSEEEALQVVREELAKAGFRLGAGMAVPEVVVEYEDPNANLFHSDDDWLGEPSAVVAQPASLSAVDSQQGLGVSIITRDDCGRFQGDVFCSVSAYDTKGLAENTAAAFRKQTKRPLCIGVFYDPLEKWDFFSISFGDGTEGEGEEKASPSDEDWRAAFERKRETAADKSRQQLRLQVQDFLAWREKNG